MASVDDLLTVWSTTNKTFDASLKDAIFNKEVYHSLKALNAIVPILVAEYRKGDTDTKALYDNVKGLPDTVNGLSALLGKIPQGANAFDLINAKGSLDNISVNGQNATVKDKIAQITIPESFGSKGKLADADDLNTKTDTGYYTVNNVKLANFYGNDFVKGTFYVFNYDQTILQQFEGIYLGNPLSVFRIYDVANKTWSAWQEAFNKDKLKGLTLADFSDGKTIDKYGVGENITTPDVTVTLQKSPKNWTFADIRPDTYTNPYL